MNRRTLLAHSAAGLVMPAMACRAQAQELRLKDLGARKGLVVGTAAETRELRENPEYAALIAAEAAMLCPTHELSWRATRPAPDRLDTRAADALLAWCERQGLKFRGGVFCWYMLNPAWLNSVAPGEQGRRALAQFITALAGHFRGRMYAWDVVNEPIFTEDGRSDGLRSNIWVRLIGPDYIDTAFRLVRATDPRAILVLNEYGFYYTHPYHELRREALLRLLRRLKERGTPVDALGIQGHLSPQGRWGALDTRRFGRFISEVAGLGYKIMISEFDVSDAALPADVATRDRLAADAAQEFLDLVLAERAVIALTIWQLSDRYSWHGWANPRPDRLPTRPLPYDAELRKKPLWNAIARALENAPER